MIAFHHADVLPVGAGDGHGATPADAIAKSEGVELVDGGLNFFAGAEEVELEGFLDIVDRAVGAAEVDGHGISPDCRDGKNPKN